MSTQPTPPLGNASPSLEVTLSSPVLLLNYTRLLLRARAATSSAAVSSQSDPLAVLLFLLDAVTFLVSSTEVGGESNAEGLDPTGDGAADESSSLSIQAAGSSSATPSRSLRAQEGARSEGPSSMRASAISGDGPVQPAAETWEDWSDYIAEVYLHSANDDSATAKWQAPLEISPNDVPLAALAAQETFDEATRNLLHSACISALTFLAQHSSSPPTSLPAPEVLQRLLSTPSVVPSARPPSILCTISNTLSSQRRSSGAPFSCPTTRTLQWTLSIVLEHFFGDAFRPVQQPDGEWAYAADPSDDQAIKRLYTVAEGERPMEEDEVEMDRESGIRAATLSISRRDDKMRWVFGDDFQKPLAPRRSSPPTPIKQKRSSVGRLSHAMGFHSSPPQDEVERLEATTDTPPAKSKGRRPVSMSSYESQFFSSTHDHSHRRVTSTSSSTSPLIDPPSSPSSPRSPQHRRGVSTGQLLKTSYSDLAPSPTAPFTNFADVSASAEPTDSPTGAPSRRVSFEAARLPPTTNTLTAQDRKELLKRSRKLEQMFGVPMEEDAVGQVLLRGQMIRQSSDCSHIGNITDSAPQRSPPFARSRSFSHEMPISPVLENGFDDSTGGSLSMSRSRSHPGPSVSPTESCFPSSARIHNPSSYSAIGGTPEAQREERRKKMVKLQRLLGEKVPAHLALSDTPGRGSTLGKSASRLSGMFKGAHSPFGRGHHSREKTPEHKEEYVVVEKQDFDSTSATKHKAKGAVDNMARARKLENVFGDLPPKTLYMSSRDVRRDSNASNLTRTTSIHTIDSFRNSIVSLQHLAETDPEALDAIVQIYAAPTSSSSTPFLATPEVASSSTTLSTTSSGDQVDPAANPKEDSETALLPPEPETSLASVTESIRSSTQSPVAPPLQRSASSSSSQLRSHHRTSRRATKLADRLGTTRGEVWTILLDDLQTAIEEEDSLDDEERREVLGGVSRLREGFA